MYILNGEHTVRFKQGLANALPQDNGIESSYMLDGHNEGGLLGNTLNENARTVWSMSLGVVCQLRYDLKEMCTGESRMQPVIKHKEEGKTKINNDESDRQKLRQRLKTCIDPLNPSGHPAEHVHIVTGRLSHESVNVHESVAIGTKSIESYRKSLPEGYHKPLKKEIITMSLKRKKVVVKKVDQTNP